MDNNFATVGIEVWKEVSKQATCFKDGKRLSKYFYQFYFFR